MDTVEALHHLEADGEVLGSLRHYWMRAQQGLLVVSYELRPQQSLRSALEEVFDLGSGEGVQAVVQRVDPRSACGSGIVPLHVFVIEESADFKHQLLLVRFIELCKIGGDELLEPVLEEVRLLVTLLLSVERLVVE